MQSIKREFGTVFIGRENVAALVLAEGLAKVRPMNQQGEGSPFFADLEKAEASAQVLVNEFRSICTMQLGEEL